MSEDVEAYSEEVVSESKKFVIIGVVDPRLPDNGIVSMYKAIEDGIILEQDGVYHNVVTGETVGIDIAMATGLIKAELIDSHRSQDYIQSYILAKTEAKIDLSDKDVLYLIDTKENKMLTVEEAQKLDILDKEMDVYLDTELQQAKPARTAIEEGLMVIRDKENNSSITHFTIQYVVCSQTYKELSLTQALKEGIIASAKGPYINKNNNFELSLYEAVITGLIKLQNSNQFLRNQSLVIEFNQILFKTAQDLINFNSLLTKTNSSIFSMLQNAKLFHKLKLDVNTFHSIITLAENKSFQEIPFQINTSEIDKQKNKFKSPLIIQSFYESESLDQLIQEYNKFTYLNQPRSNIFSSLTKSRQTTVTTDKKVISYDDIRKFKLTPEEQRSTLLIRFHDLSIVSVYSALESNRNFTYFTQFDLNVFKERVKFLSSLKSPQININQEVFLQFGDQKNAEKVAVEFGTLILNGFFDCKKMKFNFSDFGNLKFVDGDEFSSLESLKQLFGYLKSCVLKLSLGFFIDKKLIDVTTGEFLNQESGERFSLLEAENQNLLNLQFVYLIYDKKFMSLKDVFDKNCLEKKYSQFYNPKTKEYLSLRDAIDIDLVNPYLNEMDLEKSFFKGTVFEVTDVDKQKIFLNEITNFNCFLEEKLEYLSKFNFVIQCLDDAQIVSQVGKRMMEEMDIHVRSADNYDFEGSELVANWQTSNYGDKFAVQQQLSDMKRHVTKINQHFDRTQQHLIKIENAAIYFIENCNKIVSVLNSQDTEIASLTSLSIEELSKNNTKIQFLVNKQQDFKEMLKVLDKSINDFNQLHKNDLVNDEIDQLRTDLSEKIDLYDNILSGLLVKIQSVEDFVSELKNKLSFLSKKNSL